MAEPGRTVRVSGLPTDTEEGKLKDKLFIHFLRARNGGGEIDSVNIVKETPVSALITFEDSGVAQRVIQRSRHNLEVDGKKYKVTVTEHCESLDPDKIIISLSAIVNYSQLPGGRMALTSLLNHHPDVRINYDSTEKACELQGAYSIVQAALAQLLGHPEGPQSGENKDSGQSGHSDSRPAQIAPRPHSQESEDLGRKPNKKKEQRENVQVVRPSDEYNSSSYRDLTPGGYGWEDTGQAEGAALQLPWHPATSEEDLSLIVDSDMFQYLKKHCRTEYQHILTQYAVDVVDLTNQGLTTLYLQVSSGGGEDVIGHDQERLKFASEAISRLYQENETKIRRAQLPKNILLPGVGLQRAMENISVRLPKLLLNEDEKNIYIIGSSSDVSEAKQFLLFDHGEVRSKKEDVASLLSFHSYDAGSSTHTEEQRVPLTTVDSLADGLGQLLRSEENEKRGEGARRYKLAARFKDSGLAPLGDRPTDFTLRGPLSLSRPTRRGPMLGRDVLTETADLAGVSRALAQNTGGDILFKSGDALPSTASLQNKISLSPHLLDTRPKSVTSPVSTTQSSLLGSTPLLPPTGSGSTLRRASSFSGTPQKKAQVMVQKSQDDSGRSAVRVRSSSFSNQAEKDKREVYQAEIIVSLLMWQHIKEAYRTRVDDLTSDVQIKERSITESKDLTITIRGANSTKVASCQLALQKLVDSVNIDFSVQELRLSELGITDRADENLQACCDEVRSRFKKVTFHTSKKSLYLIGPRELCSQVGATLREIFSSPIPEQQDISSPPSTSNRNPSRSLQRNEDQSTSLHSHSQSQLMLESQTGRPDWTGGIQEKRTNHRSDFHEAEFANGPISPSLARTDPVIKEKVKIVGTVEMTEQNAEMFLNPSKTEHDGSASHVNGITSTTTRTDKDLTLRTKERTIHSPTTQTDSVQQRQDPPEEAMPGKGGQGWICVCGESEKGMTRTKCGATLCSKCLDTVHAHCRVCHETDPTPRGIQGKCTSSHLHIRVPGHKDSAIKITYSIPDGIQGEGHPSPGKPFKGGVFEAFLPDCEKTSRLLPRLKKAFRQGLTFTVLDQDTGACRVMWDGIPHKTSLTGGKSGNGYPDSSYLTRLSEVLTSHGIEESPAKS